MSFRFYTNAVSRASRGVAAWIFSLGLALIGFGLMIYLLPRLFATLAAAVFFIIGAGAIATAVKIYLFQKKVERFDFDNSAGYRRNVRVRLEEDSDRQSWD
jgi:hypothetical protein